MQNGDLEKSCKNFFKQRSVLAVNKDCGIASQAVSPADHLASIDIMFEGTSMSVIQSALLNNNVSLHIIFLVTFCVILFERREHMDLYGLDICRMWDLITFCPSGFPIIQLPLD
ncbi:hypothetical protein ScPMuIL_018973 [Solemya velum]